MIGGGTAVGSTNQGSGAAGGGVEEGGAEDGGVEVENCWDVEAKALRVLERSGCRAARAQVHANCRNEAI